MLSMSYHSEMRANQRSLTQDEVDYVLHYGRRYFCEGARVFYLRKKDMPPCDLRRSDMARLVGAAVVVAWEEQTVLTVWRNRKSGQKFLRVRSDRRRRGGKESVEPMMPEENIWCEAMGSC